MPDNMYPNSGTLFYEENKRNEKAPDFKGTFTLDAEVLDYVLRCARERRAVKLEASGWRRQGREKRFISFKVSMPYMERSEAPQQQSRNAYRDARDEPPRGQYARPSRVQSRPSRNTRQEDFNDDIPFGNPKEDKAPWDD